jgi:glutathione reductase (NADPH)
LCEALFLRNRLSMDFDLIVVGGGSAGVRAARMAATYGAKVAVIEADRVGGTCVIRGCIPKKLFVYAARFSEMFEIAGSYGWTVDAQFDWPTLVANKDKEIARLEAAYEAAVERPGGTIIRDRAVVTGPNSVRLQKSGTEITGKYLLIATGGHPYIPDVEGAELAITSNEAFHLEALPHSILIDGGGYVAAEFATIFAGLGVHTTIVYRGRRMLRGFDDDLRSGFDAGLEARGVRRIYETTIRKLEKRGQDVVAHFSDGVDAPFGAVMFATGRRANTAELGLEAAGVVLNPHGSIAVDTYSRTNVPSIYAVGDVTGRLQLTPLAVREGWYVAETLFNNNPMSIDLSLVGTAVFAEPEVATIGLSEADAATHGDIDVYVAHFRPMLNTLSPVPERMMMKLIAAAGGGKVLGVHILGPGAAELIQMAAIPMGMGANKADFDRAIAMHPTAGEELVTFKAPSYVYRGGVKV